MSCTTCRRAGCPARWGPVKDLLEEVALRFTPDLIIAPQRDDAHQDHRTIAEILPTVFRDQLILGYEIPKWDGDFGRPAMYFPMSADVVQRKIELLNKCFPSQRHAATGGIPRYSADWQDYAAWNVGAPYAEAFTCKKAVVLLA